MKKAILILFVIIFNSCVTVNVYHQKESKPLFKAGMTTLPYTIKTFDDMSTIKGGDTLPEGFEIKYITGSQLLNN